jgi:hypothetical protein
VVCSVFSESPKVFLVLVVAVLLHLTPRPLTVADSEVFTAAVGSVPTDDSVVVAGAEYASCGSDVAAGAACATRSIVAAGAECFPRSVVVACGSGRENCYI